MSSGYADNISERLVSLADELVALPVAIIIAPSTAETQAARKATSGGDPVALGFAASLARSGGNVTGSTTYSAQLRTKRLQLLQEALPTLSRVAVVWDSTNPAGPTQLRDLKIAAQARGVEVLSLEVRVPDDFEAALERLPREGAQALMAFGDPLVQSQRARILDFTTKNRIPAMFDGRADTEAGGLLSYGANGLDLWKRAATYVDKLLKGAKPGDLPIELPTKFDFIINLKTAQALGLTIPLSVVAQATEIIQ